MWFAMDFRRIFRRRWIAVVVPALLLGVAASAYIAHKKPMYAAKATVHIISPQSGSSGAAAAALAGGILPAGLLSAYSGGDDSLPTQAQVMVSDHNLNQVAHALRIQDTPAQLRALIDVDQDPTGANVLDLTVHDRYPVLAQRIANMVIAVYQHDLSDEGTTVLGSNAKFVRQQAAEAKQNLSAAEDALVGYSHSSGTLDADTDASKRVDAQYALQSEYLDAQQSLRAAQARNKYLNGEIATLPVAIVPNLTFERNPRIEADKSQLSQLEADRARMENEYTPKDPEMITNQTSINTVQQDMIAERKAEDASLNSSMAGTVGGKVDPGYVIGGGSRQLNPEVQALHQQLVQTQADAEAQAATVNGIKSAIDAQAVGNRGVPDVVRRLSDLKDTVALDTKLYDDLRANLQSLEARRGEDQVYASVLQPAMLPRPLSPIKNALIVFGALLAGLLAGAMAILGAEAADKRVRSPLDIQIELKLPVLASVPPLGVAKQLGASQRLFDPTQSPMAVRRLASTLAFMGLGKQIKALLLTSAVPNEGVTFVTSQLAIELAKQGQRVALVDANLRSPSVHSYFGLENNAGLAAAMRNGGHPETALVPLSGTGPLQIVASGDLSDDSATQMLSNSAKLDTLLKSLLEKADIVLIDTPAILDGVETAMLAGVADATLLVTAENLADREDVRRAAALLASSETPLLGVVVNERNAVASRRS